MIQGKKDIIDECFDIIEKFATVFLRGLVIKLEAFNYAQIICIQSQTI